MKQDKRILAVVPARSGSRGIKDKNLAKIGGKSLIQLSAECISACDFIDKAIISTDSELYAEEGKAHGLECPFLRPDELSRDSSGAIETMIHAWQESEKHYGDSYDILLIIEPTCPLRTPGDIEGTLDALLKNNAESAVCVSCVDSKYHPHKILTLNDGQLGFFSEAGASIQSRQQLTNMYYRNGACYAVTRNCLIDNQRIFSQHTAPHIIDRPLANIDTDIDLEFAEFIYKRKRY